MQFIQAAPGVTAVIRPGKASNVGLVETGDGVVVIDTTSTREEMGEVLDGAGVQASQVCQLVLTHTDGDHIGGNGLFDCPILGHRLALERMVEMGKPEKELPGETFEKSLVKEVGGVRFELTHTGGHTPDMSVVWLPEVSVLFAGDELFEGRYPFVHRVSDVKQWRGVLDWLPSFKAEVLVPGHGSFSGVEEIEALRRYLDGTWQRAAELIKIGQTKEEILADPEFPKIDDPERQHLYLSNIEFIVEMIQSQDQTSA